jgi:septum formation protein
VSEAALYLASRSPRRRQLLDQLGLSHVVLEVEVDESWDGREPPAEHVRRLALAKARIGRALLPAGRPAVVLAADTAVVIDGTILGKAEDLAAACRMLALLSGRPHRVYTGVAVIDGEGGEHWAVSETVVYFRTLAAAEIDAYCATGEPLGKAGAYAIQGRAAAFIERIEGSYSGVMGLPLFETAELLKTVVP